MSVSSLYSSSPDADALRRTFYDDVLSHAPTKPEDDFRRLAQAWRDVTNAEWVWLWLHNPFLGNTPWEIREVSCRSGQRQNYIPDHGPVAASNSVVAFACEMGEPVEVDELDWTRLHSNGVMYEVTCRGILEPMKCTSFMTIPIQSPPTVYQAEKNNTITGAICCHFLDGQPRPKHPPESLKLMAKLTAATITNAYMAAQQQILFKLNSLAHEYLADPDVRPVEDRQHYLMEVINLLQKYLGVRGASIFYQDNLLFPEVRCLATTGISQTPPDLIASNQLEFVVYKPGEGLTGECFLTGQPIVLYKEAALKHQPRFVEVIGAEVVGRKDAVLIPIPRPNPYPSRTTIGKNAPVARGVIRCSDLQNNLKNGTSRCFDQIDMVTLLFIAQQIAPVLETLTVKISRELSISVVKHDLLAPLAMIRNTADGLADSVDERTQTVKCRFYDVMNLGAAALVAANLVKQLDPDPGTVREFFPERTLLVRTIVARIKSMLSHYARVENGMTIRFDGFEMVPPLWIDRSLIERVFVNVLVNAIKYGADGTEILVQAAFDDVRDAYRIDISNEGGGIPADEADLVFERGYRSRTTKDKKMGIGLGLYIARQSMLRHKGALELTSLVDPTTFTIFIPSQMKRGVL